MNPEFAVHMLNGEGIAKARKLAEVFDTHLDEVSKLCPPGREFSIVKTKLEEACFFAKKAIAAHPSNQVEATATPTLAQDIEAPLASNNIAPGTEDIIAVTDAA